MKKDAGKTDQEIKKLKKQIKELKAELEKNQKLSILGTMASSIAHEIKNPLVAVKTFFDLLPGKYDDAEFRDSFSLVVKREVDRINELVTHLLDFARPKKPVFEKIHVVPLIHETLDLLSLQINDTNVKIEFNDTNSLPDVMADREQLARVIMNVVLNGIQAMHEGGEMKISTRASDGKIEVRFCDTGPGIDKEVLGKIFDPFFSTKHKGSGLGLAICRQIIRDHKGELKVESNPKGTTFFMLLPVSK